MDLPVIGACGQVSKKGQTINAEPAESFATVIV